MTNLQSDAVRKEPIAIIDVTGSMNEPAAPGSSMTRRDLATNIMSILVGALASEDSQGKDEAGGGGLLTISFANGVAREVGDLNPANFETKWSQIRWTGGTYIVPALEMMMASFSEEFGDLPVEVQPQLMAAIITDGNLFDLTAATRWLRSAPANVYLCVIVVGYGADHDATVASWQNVAEARPANVRVEPANASTDAHAIAQRILAMVQ